MKTAELMRKNEKLNRELIQLKKETAQFVQDVFSNPENAYLVNPQFGDLSQQPRTRQQKSVMFEDGWTSGKLQQNNQTTSAAAIRNETPATSKVFVSQNLDFHIIDSQGRVTPLPTVLTTTPNNNPKPVVPINSGQATPIVLTTTPNDTPTTFNTDSKRKFEQIESEQVISTNPHAVKRTKLI